MVKLSKIKANPNNPRIIRDERFKKLKDNIERYPKFLEKRPIIIDSFKNPIVLGGNMRLRALQELGYKEIPDEWVKEAKDFTEEEKRAFIIIDNVGFGEEDWEKLANEWDETELADWGLEMPHTFGKEAIEDDYEIPDEIKTDIVTGDLFEIGQHRLLCGDSTNADDVAKVMDGQKADITFTSPPYNAGKNSTLSPHQANGRKYIDDDDNKNPQEYYQLLIDSTKNALLFSVYSFINVQSIAGNKTILIDYLHDLKEVYADTLIWQKQNAQPAMAKNVLNSQFEYIHCFSEKATRAVGIKSFRGTLSNVVQISKQNNNEVKSHNATFPVALPAHFIENFTIQSVLDLFLGSGTTMVAAHQLNRKCIGIEISPQYCQIIVERMLKLDPTLEIKRNGKPYSLEDKNTEKTPIHA